MITIKSLFKSKKEHIPVNISRDPVCGMKSTEGISIVHKDIEYSFCSDHCKQQFGKNPEAYITK